MSNYSTYFKYLKFLKPKYLLVGNFFIMSNLYLYIENKKKSSSSNKLNIIFDLDETLIHTINTKKNLIPSNYIEPDFSNISNRYIWIRPGVKLLLEHIGQFNNIYLYTRATESYTNNILNQIELNHCFLNKKYRNDCKKNNCKNILDFTQNISNSYLIDDKNFNQCKGQKLYKIKPFYPIKFYFLNITLDIEFFKLYLCLIWLNISNDLLNL